MSRPSDYEFISADVDAIQEEVETMYSAITGQPVKPSSPQKLFAAWVASVIAQANARINIAANQNLPSRATGANLDALAELFFMKSRPEATAAGVVMEFTISQAQPSTVYIPMGTRITTNDNIIFATDEDAFVEIGETTTSVHCTCQTPGTVGNGYAAGVITKLVDVFPYYASCVNTDDSDGGSDVPDDDEFYDMLVASEAGYSCAGAEDAYIYHAKSVASTIADVIVNSPVAGEVRIYVLMETGQAAGEEIKSLVLSACNAREARPLTDLVSVHDPETASYDIAFTYYIDQNAASSAADIAAAVGEAVDNFVLWQAGKLGRDINPSRLIRMVMEVEGVKRVDVVSPAFTVLRDGTNTSTLALSVPQLARVGTITITNGGPEYE